MALCHESSNLAIVCGSPWILAGFSRRSSPTLSEGGRVTGKDLAGGSSGWAYSYPLWHITERTPATNHAHVDTCLCPSRRCPHSRAHVRSRFIVPEGSRV